MICLHASANTHGSTSVWLGTWAGLHILDSVGGWHFLYFPKADGWLQWPMNACFDSNPLDTVEGHSQDAIVASQ